MLEDTGCGQRAREGEGEGGGWGGGHVAPRVPRARARVSRGVREVSSATSPFAAHSRVHSPVHKTRQTTLPSRILLVGIFVDERACAPPRGITSGGSRPRSTPKSETRCGTRRLPRNLLSVNVNAVSETGVAGGGGGRAIASSSVIPARALGFSVAGLAQGSSAIGSGAHSHREDPIGSAPRDDIYL